MAGFLQCVVIGGAVLAAIFWLVSALVTVPDMEQTTIGGDGSITDIMRKQSRWSAAGAGCAAISAICQAIIEVMK